MTMLKIAKHELSGAYMNLDMSKETMLVVNYDHIISYSYNINFTNGYGNKFPYMKIELSNGTDIQLYREDAIAAVNALKKLEKSLKASE